MQAESRRLVELQAERRRLKEHMDRMTTRLKVVG